MSEPTDQQSDTPSLDQMERDREIHLHSRFYERAVAQGDVEEAKRIAKLMLHRFGIDVSAD